MLRRGESNHKCALNQTPKFCITGAHRCNQTRSLCFCSHARQGNGGNQTNCRTCPSAYMRRTRLNWALCPWSPKTVRATKHAQHKLHLMFFRPNASVTLSFPSDECLSISSCLCLHAFWLPQMPFCTSIPNLCSHA
jgi:hypothetical protein